MRRTLRTLAALAMVALISAGCSNAPAETGTGSSGGNNTAATHEQAVKFAECMRENGVSDFPDPDAAGEFDYGVSVTPAVWTAAVHACKALQPPGSLSAKRSTKQQSAALRFAQCVREHGVKDFPDPTNGQPMINTYKIPSANKPGGMTILNAATAKCGKLLGSAAGGR